MDLPHAHDLAFEFVKLEILLHVFTDFFTLFLSFIHLGFRHLYDLVSQIAFHVTENWCSRATSSRAVLVPNGASGVDLVLGPNVIHSRSGDHSIDFIVSGLSRYRYAASPRHEIFGIASVSLSSTVEVLHVNLDNLASGGLVGHIKSESGVLLIQVQLVLSHFGAPLNDAADEAEAVSVTIGGTLRDGADSCAASVSVANLIVSVFAISLEFNLRLLGLFGKGSSGHASNGEQSSHIEFC